MKEEKQETRNANLFHAFDNHSFDLFIFARTQRVHVDHGVLGGDFVLCVVDEMAPHRFGFLFVHEKYGLLSRAIRIQRVHVNHSARNEARRKAEKKNSNKER